MIQRHVPIVLSAALGLALAVSPSRAMEPDTQPETKPATPTPVVSAPVAPSYVAPEAYSPSWSDDEIATIATQLTGTWTTTAPTSGSSTISMTIAPVPVQGMSDTMYVESVLSGSVWKPYRQSIFQLYRYKGEIRLRTYSFAIGDISVGLFDGMWAATELFPALKLEDLIATLDIEIESTDSGFTGSTPYPYPTAIGGAVEMTSSITLDGDTLSVADRGFDASGAVVWGGQTESVGFQRSEPYATVTRTDDGMVMIDYVGDSGILPQVRDELHVHYDGYIGNGFRFDSSYPRNQPFVFVYPPGTRAIQGWGIGMDNFAMGMHRKLCIPGYMAYGERGNPRANIPSNEMLFFNAFMAHIEPAPALEIDPNESHEGHDHD